jgi:hypothetical protein
MTILLREVSLESRRAQAGQAFNVGEPNEID